MNVSKNDVLSNLSRFVSFPSVSAQPSRQEFMGKSVIFLISQLKDLGFQCEEMKIESFPACIIATYQYKPGAPTIGIYGHYDIQPEDPIDKWLSDPFDLVRREGKLYGRGVADNKGHIIQNIEVLRSVIKSNRLKANIVFIIEGEEELGSVHFEKYISEYREKRNNKVHLEKVDVWYITDTGMRNAKVPQIYYGLRGLIYFELNIKTGVRDLHSGIYGNRVLNSIHVLSDIIASIKDGASGKVLIPNFYDPVRHIPEMEMKSMRALSRLDEEEMGEAGVWRLLSQCDLTPSLVTKLLPSFDLHGISGGYTGAGSKTIIPNTASAKFSFRLVEHQKASEIEKLVRNFVAEKVPEGAKYELVTNSLSDPFYCSIDDPLIKRTGKILSETFGHEVVYNRSGGSVPAAEIMQRLFGKPIILTGFTLPDDNIHSPNENFDEETFFRGMIALENIYLSY